MVMQTQTYTPKLASKYRKCDETETDSFKHFADRVSGISTSIINAKVLDVGCGTGRYFRYVYNAKTLFGVDPSEAMIAEARNPASGINDITSVDCFDPFDRVSFCSNYFDFVYCIGVLGEHIEFDDAKIGALYRWMSPGGFLFFTIVDKAAKPAKIEALHDYELSRIMMRSQFDKYSITHKAIDSEFWKGAHFLVEAIK